MERGVFVFEPKKNGLDGKRRLDQRQQSSGWGRGSKKSEKSTDKKEEGGEKKVRDFMRCLVQKTCTNPENREEKSKMNQRGTVKCSRSRGKRSTE